MTSKHALVVAQFMIAIDTSHVPIGRVLVEVDPPSWPLRRINGCKIYILSEDKRQEIAKDIQIFFPFFLMYIVMALVTQ